MKLHANFDILLKELQDVVNAGVPAVKVGLYETAGMVRTAIATEAGSLPFKPSTVRQIQNSVGISKMESSVDEVNVSIACDGYFEDSGFPIPFFVREVEKGTSRIPANDFSRRAFNRVRAQAEAKGQQRAEEFVQNAIDKITDK